LFGKKEKVRNVKTISGKEVLMQHHLVVMDILCRKIQNINAVQASKVKFWSLKHNVSKRHWRKRWRG